METYRLQVCRARALCFLRHSFHGTFGVHYRSFAASPWLRDFVRCHWDFESACVTAGQRLHIVPDGGVSMVFHCADSYWQYLDKGRGLIQPQAFLIRPSGQPLVLEALGKSVLFATRFQPHGWIQLTGLQEVLPANMALALDVVLGAPGAALADAVLHASCSAARLAEVEAFLCRFLCRHEVRPDPAVQTAVKAIVSGNEAFRQVTALALHAGTSCRQLERKFARQIGISPKQLIRLNRVQNAIRQMQSQSFSSLTELAQQVHFYDQAHFIKDFKTLTHMTPRQFQQSQVQMSLFHT